MVTTMTEKTNDEIYEIVLDTRTHVVELREDFVDLKSHVNDQLEVMSKQIDGKLDDNQLLTSLGFKLLNNKAGRWVIGVITFTALATIASERWLPIVHKIVGLLTGI